MTMKISPGKVESFLLVIGLDVDKDGFIITEDGEYASVAGKKEKIHKDNIALVEYNDEYPSNALIIPDNPREIRNHLKRRNTGEHNSENVQELVQSFAEELHAEQLKKQPKKNRTLVHRLWFKLLSLF